jgi:hypothetical protein
MLGDERTDGGGIYLDASFRSPPIPPLCDKLGQSTGVCACVDVPLLGDPPNLYFVLDRSGSMVDSNKWSTVRSALENLVIQLGPRAAVGAAVFPDPRTDSCDPGVQVFPSSVGKPQRGDAPSGSPGPTELALLTVLGHIGASGGTPTAATFQRLTPQLLSFPGQTYVILATDGGPNCNAAATCTADQCQCNIENISSCPPGGPLNCCLASGATVCGGGPLNCEDSTPTLDAVRALSSKGVPLYVVGVPASEPYAALLDELAMAGGKPRDGDTKYYAVTSTDQAAFQKTIFAIAAQITSPKCTFDLGSPPSDASLVNVFLDGQPLASQGANGWTLSGSSVTILGASCQRILDGDVLDVRAAAGCPTVQH